MRLYILLPVAIKKKKVQNYDIVAKASEIIGRKPEEIKQIYFEETQMHYLSFGPLEEYEYETIIQHLEVNDSWTHKNTMKMEDYIKVLPSSVTSTAIVK